MQRITKSRCGHSLLAGVVWMLAIGQHALADEHDVDALLNGISGIGAPGAPGPLCVYGPDAFPLVEGATGNTRVPVVAAGRSEKGRIVALGHDRYFEPATVDTADTRLLLTNAIEWAAGEKSSPRIGVAKSAVGAGVEELRDWLMDAGYDLVEVALTSDALAQVDVLIMTMWNQTEREQDDVGAFVRAGGGLVTAATGWGWAYLHPDKNLVTDFAGNRLLASVGIQWGDFMYIERTSESGYAVSGAPNTLTHAIEALDAMEAHDAGSRALTESEVDQALATLERTIQCLPPNDTLIAPRLRSVIEGAEWPSADNPVDVSDVTGRLAAALFVFEQRRLPAESVRAHPAAADFPGSVPDDAERITRSLTIDTFARRHSIGLVGEPFAPVRHSTGLYAAPGELVTVTVPAAAAESGAVQVLVGAHTRGIWPKAEWTRMPEISRRFEVSSPTTRVANAFGGLIYIEVSNEADLGTVAIEIEGAVAAPRFVLGETSPAEWRNEIRDAPAPWAEIEGTNMIVTTESAKVRALDDPTDVAETWDRVLDLNAELAAWAERRISPERFVVDRQLPYGWMLSGYPLLAHIEGNQSSYIVDAQHISTCRQEWTGSNWGFFHEVGHNHQSDDWTFDGTVEVTVNLFTLYVYEFLCGIVPAGRFAGSSKSWAEEMERYDFDDPDFGLWKQHPFLALIMYAQLQQEFGWEAFRHVFAEYRNLEAAERPKSDEEKRDQWLERFSRTVGRNLGPFFEAWGVPTSQTARDNVAHLPKWLPAGFPPGALDQDASYEVNEALPRVPWSGPFAPETLSEGRYASSGTGTTITLDEGGYFELADGTRYTCSSMDGCSIANGAVTTGAVVRWASGSVAENGVPSFRGVAGPGDRNFQVGKPIDAVTLPEATGGNGTLSYTLVPEVPGLRFEVATRQLTGSPDTPGTFVMTYTATDENGDSDTISFTIVTAESFGTQTIRDCFVGLVVRTEETCNYPGTSDEFSVDVRGRGSFLELTSSFRIVLENETVNGRVYDLRASSEGDGAWRIDRIASSSEPPAEKFYLSAHNAFPGGITYANEAFYVVNWRDEKVYVYSQSGQHDAVAGFSLDDANKNASGIAHANGRFYIVDWRNAKVYAYLETGQRDAAGDFDLDEANDAATGIVYANGRFYVVQGDYPKVYVYTATGQRDQSAEFELAAGGYSAIGITHADGRFHIVDAYYDRVYAYTSNGQREALADFNLYTFRIEDAGGIAYANGRLHVVDRHDNKVYAYTATGLRDALADFDMDPATSSPSGITYAEGRFYVVDGNEEKTFAYTASGERDPPSDFELDANNSRPEGITYADGRFYIVDGTDDKVYAYSVTGQRDAMADFDLHDGYAGNVQGITYGNGQFFVVRDGSRLASASVIVYDTFGQHDAAAGFNLDVAFLSEDSPAGIVYAFGRLYFVDSIDELVFSYPLPDDSDNGDGADTDYGVGDTIAELPYGAWLPDLATGARVTSRSGQANIQFDHAGYIEEGGYRYTCATAGGCEFAGREVELGTIARTSAGTPADTQPSFEGASGVGNPSYRVGTAIEALALPEASGGNGKLKYTLTPDVPGLTFDAVSHRLMGTPSTMGTYEMNFTATDEDGDTDTLKFTLAVEQADDGAYAESFDLLNGNSEPEGITFADGRILVVDLFDDKVYAYAANGQRDASGDFDLDADNTWPTGITHAEGRFYVADLRDEKVYAYTGSGQRDASADFELDADNRGPTGITYSNGRFYVVDGGDEKVYAYDVNGQRDASADFALDVQNSVPAGITHAADKFYVVDQLDELAYAYTATGQRDAAGDFKLDAANTGPTGIAYTAGLFLVVEPTDDTAYAYSDGGQRNPVSDVRFQDGNDNAVGIAHTDRRFLVVDRADNKVYAYTASGQRDAGADFDLDAENRNPEGITLAEGRFYVVDGDDAKVYAYTVTGQRDSAADFALNEKNGSASGIAYAAGRFHVVDLSDNRVYAYSLSGQPDAAGDFDLGADIASGGIAVAAGYIYVVDWFDEKVYAYTATGQRDTSADFDLEENNSDPEGIAYAAGRFYVVDNAGARVYSYGDSEGQDDGQGQPTAVMTGSSVAESSSGYLETGSIDTGAERSIFETDEGGGAQNARIVGGVWGTAGSSHQDNSRSDPYFFRIRGIAVGLTGADFDGDGSEDLVAKSAKGHTYLVSAVDLKEADGSDGIEDRTIDLDRASVPSNSLRLPAVHHDRVFRAGDIDFDGMDDLIVHDLLVSASVLRNATAGDRVLRLPLEHPRPDTGILRIAGSRLDRSAFALADFNADGVNDLLVGIPSRKGEMGSSVDTVYVASGVELAYADAMDGTLDGAISLDRMARSSGSWKIVSDTRIAMGTSIGPVGDLNGDGFVDLMIGAPDMPFGANPYSGGLIVVSGAAMASLDAADGVTDGEIKITQGRQEGTWKLGGSDFDIGTTASAAGDTDGDGLNDLLLAANSGVYLVTGASIMATGSGGQMSATGTKRFAWMHSGLGVNDIDSDGLSDILLLGYGNAYLISGWDLQGLGDANGVVDFGIDTVPAHSWRLSFRDPSIELQGSASLADLNGDGQSELIVPASVKGEVETYIISPTALRLLDLEDGQADGVVHLDQIGRSFAVN